MQPSRNYRGDQSHLFNSIRSYLCNQNRAQPIIGLSSITELCTDADPPVYLCDVCLLRINRTDIKTHIMGSLHRHNYIRCHHVRGLRADEDLTHLAWHLMELAKLIEKKEGTGNVQVLHLDNISYKKMTSHPVVDVLAQVSEITKLSSMNLLPSTDYEKPTEGDCCPSWASSSTLPMPQSKGQRSSAFQDSPEELSLHCWMPVNGSSPEGDITIQNPVRPIIEIRTPSPSGYPSPSDFQSESPPVSQSRAFSPGTPPRSLKRWSPFHAPEQNGSIHPKRAKNQSRFINTECVGTELHNTHKNTAQTTKCKGKHIAVSQDRSLTVTITQQPETVNVKKCEEERSEEISHILKMIRTQGLLTTSVTQDQNQNLDQYDNYQELEDDSYSSGGQSPKYSMESPKSYTGTHPLIGLQNVIKCESVNGDPAPCCYLCQACCLKVLKNDIVDHLISPQHYLNYINFQHPYLSVGLESGCYSALYDMATQLEQEEGRGQMKVTRLSACLFNEVLERDYHWCIKMLNCGSTDEVRPKQGTLKEISHMTSGYSVIPKSPAELSGLNLGHNDSGTPCVLFEKLPLRQSRRAKKKRILSKAGCKEPVFKVCLSLKQGPIVVDRTSLVTPTVAPEIECQHPMDLNTENNTLPDEHVTSSDHIVTPEELHQIPETFQNTERYSVEQVHPEENTGSMGFTDGVTRTYECIYNSQISDNTENTGTYMSSLNTIQMSNCSFLGIVNSNSFVEETSGVNYSVDGLTSINKSSWTLEEQTRNDSYEWALERHKVTQNAINWLAVPHIYVPVRESQIRFAEQSFNQGMLGESNFGVIHSPTHVYSGATWNYFPAMNTHVTPCTVYDPELGVERDNVNLL